MGHLANWAGRGNERCWLKVKQSTNNKDKYKENHKNKYITFWWEKGGGAIVVPLAKKAEYFLSKEDMRRCGGLRWFGSKRSTFSKTKIGFYVRLYSMTRCGYALKCLALLVRQGVFPGPRHRFWSPTAESINRKNQPLRPFLVPQLFDLPKISMVSQPCLRQLAISRTRVFTFW